MAAGKVVAHIPAGLPGKGGEIAFGFDAVWANLNRHSDHESRPVEQRRRQAGDSIRAGLARCG
jgi:hypothetical protein